MSQSFAQMLGRVRTFHEKHEFAENNGHDMAYRLLLTMEELGELAECITKGKPQSERAEELADLLILTLGHAIAMDLDLEAAFDAKLEEVMQRPAIQGDLGVRVTRYEPPD
ncbi:MAG: nucleoside triphosphate pyrophosphohydrolase family protein [Candidatus Poseidoniia archaeon]|jgi:NTP pyrophosphatase (non-canonical NTP hydrolase)|uniref:NTP pyrophosphohydrolase MazG-like domain-containing protein n=1 Tax=marine metagenome TaxID=408172 RepID=A0A381Y8U3_9ZZZZ|nr:pyrophosphatase [Euryarchaeota archaeon]MCH2447513.1 nucleoside triphosphate pyrophosphohydrolase family protein [Candidatus Poseidoniia archaeon]MDP6236794.1 nucleoside triphosphate pyrophosphohydrolase family protein [Candidatus Poseidoniia archaeon]MDP7082227.1 nucleoside triphosphate pyrophosphohydrolase family protein [Candidatus Poseidoniia archaeon]MDP7256221.1 nucleoside triphosphate pyrophosphohydrolase family protein [Candidatus Poseidoniia archaeon]|tara:strand:- start:509 stop:841 length:333 start_codon:yes stop_codon:yes gene_type:complete